jgi:rod shape-determining protein MreD
MATVAPRRGTSIIVLSYVAALLLTVTPLPSWLLDARPEWVALFVLFWCIALPERSGIGTAWMVGLLTDVLRGALLGQHALALTVIAYLALKLHLRLRVYPLWQQALSVLVLVTIYQLLLLWTSGMIGKPATSWVYWLPSLTSTLVWPLLFGLLTAVRRGFEVS